MFEFNKNLFNLSLILITTVLSLGPTPTSYLRSHKPSTGKHSYSESIYCNRTIDNEPVIFTEFSINSDRAKWKLTSIKYHHFQQLRKS